IWRDRPRLCHLAGPATGRGFPDRIDPDCVETSGPKQSVPGAARYRPGSGGWHSYWPPAHGGVVLRVDRWAINYAAGKCEKPHFHPGSVAGIRETAGDGPMRGWPRRPRLALPFTILTTQDKVQLVAGEDFRYTLAGPGLQDWLPDWLAGLNGRVPLDAALE